jgi:peptide-methionine (S)-S-oxide reductase
MSHAQIAIFAGGCFWCTEPVFSQLKGVSKVESGYIGGHTENPTYKTICNGDTGHAEAIRITFNSEIVSFETLLEIFFISHDPTTPNRQGNDVGTQYRSAVFCQNAEQQKIVAEMIAKFNAASVFNAPIVTQINYFIPLKIIINIILRKTQTSLIAWQWRHLKRQRYGLSMRL